jgi:hypothetical protein
MIEATIYSYKNKNLLDVVNTLVQNTTNEIIINVYDQHQFDRSTLFQNYYNVIYNHIFWDYQDSPTKYKAITIAETNADYILLLSDDVIVRPGWDVELINFIKDSQVVISGMVTPSSGCTRITRAF